MAAWCCIAAIVGLFLYYHNRESTDDAQIDGHITPIASKIYGKVANVLVDDNQAVKAGQVLVKIDPRDYQAAVDQAKAALELAESEARSAGVDVPRTAENVASGTSSADAQLLGAQADVAQVRRQLTNRRRRRIWRVHKRMWTRARRMRRWRRRIWRGTSR